MSFGVTSPVDFGNNTSYDNTQITTSVYVLTTDLRTTEKVFSSNSVTMAPSSVICDSAAACNTAACKACVTTTTGTRSVATSICPSGSMNVSTCYTPGICDVITTDTGCVPAGTTWYCTESYNGGGVGNCGKTTSTFNNSASGSGYSRTCLTTDYPPCLSTGPQPTLVYLCTTSSSGAGIGNCSYTTSATNISASGTGYSTACRIQNTSLDYEYPACQSTAAPAKPSCPGTITNANSYTCSELGRTLLGGSSDYNIASNQQCCGDTIPVTAANCGGSVACTAPMCQACSSSQSSTSTRASSACASGVENTYICYTPGTCPNIVTGTGCVPLADIWYCTTSVQGAGVGNCGQSTSATNVSATGSGYNTTCSTSGYPACQSTAASGGGGSTTNCSTCNASGTEACGSGGTRTYCITPAGCADIYGPCNEPVFAPPSFPSKGFTPPTFFDPPFFPPTFFDPPFFPPAFKGFSPPAFFEPPFFPPSFKAKCLAPNALVLTTNGEIEAQHINVGDSLITISSSHIDINSISLENKSGPLPVSVGLTNSKVTSVTLKTSTLIGFNEMSKNYSVTQPIFIKSEGGIEYRNAGEIKIGDVIINVDPSGIISEISVSSIQVDEAESTVYDIRTTPEPWFIVNSALVIA